MTDWCVQLLSAARDKKTWSTDVPPEILAGRSQEGRRLLDEARAAAGEQGVPGTGGHRPLRGGGEGESAEGRSLAAQPLDPSVSWSDIVGWVGLRYTP